MRGMEVVLGTVLAGATVMTFLVLRGPAGARGPAADLPPPPAQNQGPVPATSATGDTASEATDTASETASAAEDRWGTPKTADEGTADGRTAAEADVAAGQLGWRTFGGWGYPAPGGVDRVTLAEVLERDFQVRVHHHEGGRGCIPPMDEVYQRARMDAYNAAMTTAIEARHGRGVLDIARQRADQETSAREASLAACEKGNKAACAALDPGTRERNHLEVVASGQGGCSPPYIVDARGVKRIKPHCL